jgi:hypothetical protein
MTIRSVLFRALVTTVLALLVFAAGAYAQGDARATLTGIVTDPSGAAIPGATVRAVNIANNAIKEAQTTAAGVYTIPYLDPGVYTIEVTATGFQTLKREQIVLRVADRVNLPLQLTVGQLTQEITVVGQQEVLETADANRGLVFDPIKTQQYPLNGRQTYMLLMLTPGVIFTQETFGATGFSGTNNYGVSANFRFNAARAGGNLFLLNGMNVTSYFSGTGYLGDGTWNFGASVEAVQEFKVMTNTFDASYGLFRGGVVNTTTKSGSNNWRGDVFEFWRNSIFDANYFQNKAQPNADGTAKDPGLHNQHQFGGVVGGPIRKDKDFVFGSYEGWQEVIPFSIVVATPPVSLRDGQHFTKYGVFVYDPVTRRYCDSKVDINPITGKATCTVNNSARTYVSDPFPNNVIPAARISPIGAKIAAYWPAPNAPGDTNGLNNNYLAGSNTGRYYYEQPMARWDHVFSSKDKFYAFYSWQQGYEFRSKNFPDRTIIDGGDLESERHDQNVILDWTRVVSPTQVFDIQASYGRYVQLTPGYTRQQLAMDYHDLGIKNIPVAPTYAQYKVIPHISMTGANAIFGNGSTFYWAPIDYWGVNPSFNWARGKHTLRFGLQYRYYMSPTKESGATSGSLSFSQNDTTRYGSALSGLIPPAPGMPSYTMDGSGMASLLLGVVNSGSIAYNDSNYYTRPFYSMYVQDDWKVSPKLTLNLGLRYDIQVGNKERFARGTNSWDWSYRDPNSDAILAKWAANKATWDAANPNDPFKYPAVPTRCCYGKYVYPKPGERVGQTDWTNLGPRLGAAYRLSNKTVIRGGIGLYYEQSTQPSGISSMFNTTTSINTTADDGFRNRSAVAGLTGPYSLENPYPLGIRTPPQRAWTGIGGGVSFYNSKWHGPASWQYSFTIQQELPHQIALEVGYNGNQTYHLATSYNYNQIGNAGPDTWAYREMAMWYPSGTYSYTGRNVPNPFYGILDPLVGYGTSSTISASTLMTPNPAYGSITEASMQNYHYRGDSMTLKLEQRAMASESKGTLTWVLSYAFSKAFSSSGRPFGDYALNLPANFSSYPGYKQGMGSGLNSANSGAMLPYTWAMDSSLKPNNIAFSGVYDLPLGKGKKWANTNWLAKNVMGDWRFDWIFDYVSGNGIGYWNYFNYCGKWEAAKQDEDHWFNNDKSCYGPTPSGAIAGYLYEPQPGYGVIPNYAGTGFPTKVREPQAPALSIAFEKTITISERYRMSIRGESFNVANSPIRNSVISTSYTNTNFGILNKSQKNWPRFCQVSAKFYF